MADRRKKKAEAKKPDQELIGGLIFAADSHASPLRKVGSLTALTRTVRIFLRAQLWPIVVVTGANADSLEQELSSYAVCFQHAAPDSSSLEQLNAALPFMAGKCRRIFITGMDTPLVRPSTLQALQQKDLPVILPVWRGKAGSPILLSTSLCNSILSQNGDLTRATSIYQAVLRCGEMPELAATRDPGVLPNTRLEQDAETTARHDQLLMRPFLRIGLEQETPFMGGKLELLLILLAETHSMKESCEHLAVSGTQAWNMINRLEKELGYRVVARPRGNRRSGHVGLTPGGKDFLRRYFTLERRLQTFALQEFQQLFPRESGEQR